MPLLGLFMGGWKTWLAVAGMTALGVADIMGGDFEGGITKFVYAVGGVGLGNKLDKAKP